VRSPHILKRGSSFDSDAVISVSKKVNSLGVPVRALQAWDSNLITGEVRYLVLLMDFGPRYPVSMDNGTRGEGSSERFFSQYLELIQAMRAVEFRVGLSPKYKPSKTAIAGAFRAHGANTYTGPLLTPREERTALISRGGQTMTLRPSHSVVPSTRCSETSSKKFS
jgi:hypothetical protein